MIRLLLALLLCSGAAQAASLAGVTLPDTLAVDGQTLALNGLGLRTLTIFHVRAYVAGLYVPQRSGDERQIVASPGPKAIVLQFLHSASKSAVERQFHTGETVNCGSGGCDPADQADFDRIVGSAPSVDVGDTFTFALTNRGVRFYANGRLLAQSSRPDLGRLFLLGFIGAHAPSEDLRAHLLGRAS